MLKTIIVIEDDDMIRENVSEFLSLKGFNTKEFRLGREALNEVERVKPDLVLCDMILPDLSGKDILEHLRNNFPDNDIPFIFLSSKADKLDIRTGMELGADDYITKPFTMSDLLKAIESRLSKSEKSQDYILKSIQKKLDNFPKILSHELNTPLNGILGLSLLIKSNLESYTKQDISACLDSIIESAKRLMNTQKKIFAFFDMLDKKDEDINQISSLEDIISIIKFHIKSLNKPNVEIINEIKDDEINLKSDIKIIPDHLNIILEELLDNAIKYGVPHQPIFIKLSFEKKLKQLQIQVINSVNESKKLDLNISNVFINIERSIKGNQGFGLGLLIIKKLCLINNIGISFSNEKCQTNFKLSLNIMK